MKKILRKRFDLPEITVAGADYKDEFELDKHATKIKGILITADREDKLYYRGTLQVILNGDEIIPENYHARLLMSGLGVNPNERFLTLNMDPGNAIMKVAYTDNVSSVAGFNSYTVSIYVEYEIEA
jgi:hypothetical protein